MSKIKLSDSQKEVIRKMRNGCNLIKRHYVAGRWYLSHTEDNRVSGLMATSLLLSELVEFSQPAMYGDVYVLTKYGKTIPLD